MPGVIKCYTIDKLKLEVPANRHDEIIPKRYYDELE